MSERRTPSIAILGTRGLPPRYGGFEVLADQLARRLPLDGFPVTVYCPSAKGPRPRDYQGARLEYIWHPPGPLGALLYDGLCLAHACASGVEALLMLGYAGAPFLLLPALLGRKLLLNPDGLEWRRSKWTRPARAYLKICEVLGARFATSLAADSTTIQEYFRKRRGISSTFIPYGAEAPPDPPPPDWPSLGLAPRDYYISVTRLEPENSVQLMIEGFLRARTSRRLALVTGPSTPYFRAVIEPLLRNHPRIAYLGPVYDRALTYALRANAFAYLHGNTVGGTSPALLEAMSAGRPVVARENEYSREVLGDDGFYFRDAPDLSSILERLEGMDDAGRDAMAAGARRRLEPTYTWAEVARRYAAALRAL